MVLCDEHPGQFDDLELVGLSVQLGYFPDSDHVKEVLQAGARLVHRHVRGARWVARGLVVLGVLWGWISAWVPRAYQILRKWKRFLKELNEKTNYINQSLAEQPQQNVGCQDVQIYSPVDLHDLCTLNLASNVCLVHPACLGAYLLCVDIGLHLYKVFCDAALGQEGILLKDASNGFLDISWGLLFAMFGQNRAKTSRTVEAQ
eukprot:1151017-Rhodomonas_salina.1